MTRSFILLCLICIVSFSTNAAPKKKGGKVLQKIYTLFDNGKYQDTLKALDKLERRIKNKDTSKYMSMIFYWRGLTYARINEFDFAADNFGKAIKRKYLPEDIYYELGQALYVSEKLKPAVAAFQNSVRVSYKKAVSLYYIGFIYQQRNRNSKAITYYKMIEKLPEDERKEVIQASRTQVGDIYLEQAKKLPDSFLAVEEYVIPQYERAIEADEDSKMANELRIKVRKLLRDYDLLLFQLRNGKSTAIPRYFLSSTLLTGYNDNVNSGSEDEIKALKLTDNDPASMYSTASAFGRYSFYPTSWLSIAPEFRAGTTKYFSSSDAITALDSSYYTVGLKTNYEHLYSNRPATLYMDIEYTGNNDDSNNNGTLEASSVDMTVTVSEEVQFWVNQISIMRLKFNQTTGEDTASSLDRLGFIFEQYLTLSAHTLVSYMSYDVTTYKESDSESLDTNSFLWRLDWLLPSLYGIMTPSLNYSLSHATTPNDSDKEATILHTFGVALTRQISRKWFMTMNGSYGTMTGGADDESDFYTQTTASLSFEYVY